MFIQMKLSIALILIQIKVFSLVICVAGNDIYDDSECGKASSTINLIANGGRERRGGAPWHLAIYSTQWSPAPDLICGATLINAEVAISAAHCFHNEVFNKKMNTSFYYVIVGKTTPDFNKQDYPTTKTYTLKNIYFPDDVTFEGAPAGYAGDIAILHLSEEITYSQDVFPACLDWKKSSRFNPGENVKGKLSGFGEKEDGTMPSELLTANLPYISYGECKNKVRQDFRYSISTDKFCAGSVKGAGARKGDSGGGLLFMDNETELYYLRGVVSNRDLSDSSIATFTDVAQHMSWIIKIIKEIELCRCNPDGTVSGSCDPKTGRCQCKVFIRSMDSDTCEEGYWKIQTSYQDGCLACACSSIGSHSSAHDKINGSCRCPQRVDTFGRPCSEKNAFKKNIISLNWYEN